MNDDIMAARTDIADLHRALGAAFGNKRRQAALRVRRAAVAAELQHLLEDQAIRSGGTIHAEGSVGPDGGKAGRK